MNRRALLSLAAFATLAYAQDASADLPTAKQILDRYIQATGGDAARAKVGAVISTGAVELLGLKGTVSRYANPQGDYYVVIELPQIGKIESGIKGGVVWSLNPIAGPSIVTGSQAIQATREAELLLTWDWRKRATGARTTGVAPMDGQDCYVVEMPDGTAAPMKVYFQKQSGLPIAMEAVLDVPTGPTPMSAHFSDYREFGGILSPAKTVQKTMGQEVAITIDRTDRNADIPASRFELPAAVAALAKK